MSMAVLLGGLVLYASRWVYASWIYLLGSIGLLAAKLLHYAGLTPPNVVLRRLYLQQVFSGVALVLSALFMQTSRGNEWIGLLCIAAVLELYTAFRIPAEERKV